MLTENGFSDMGPKIRFLCYQKRPFLIRHFLIKFSDSPILLENGGLSLSDESYQMKAPVAPSRSLREAFKRAPRSLRGASKAQPRTLRGGLRTLRGGCTYRRHLLKPAWRSVFAKSSRRLREALTVPSSSIHAMGSPWRLREGFATSSRALHEDVAGAEGFSHTHGGFAKASRRRHGRLHSETIRQIMTSPPICSLYS